MIRPEVIAKMKTLRACVGCRVTYVGHAAQAFCTKECWRLSNQAAKYGLTREEFDDLKRRADGRCMICHTPFHKKEPFIDHDPQTGRVRGLLCHLCNFGLGYFKDDPTRIASAVTYLLGG